MTRNSFEDLEVLIARLAVLQEAEGTSSTPGTKHVQAWSSVNHPETLRVLAMSACRTAYSCGIDMIKVMM